MQEEGMEELLSQGAEALVYKCYILPRTVSQHTPCIRKHRPRKTYRHPTLDAKLTRHRVLSEARILQKCRKLGLPVPAVLFLRHDDIYMQYIHGISVRDYLFLDTVHVEEQRQVMGTIGQTIALLHANHVVHGDLTTSNLLLQNAPTVGNGDENGNSDTDRKKIWMIDFGLSSTSLAIDDKAVDLYVLERAFLSTHPSSTHLFQLILDAYRDSGGHAVLKRLYDVRMRGRKRTMVG